MNATSYLLYYHYTLANMSRTSGDSQYSTTHNQETLPVVGYSLVLLPDALILVRGTKRKALQAIYSCICCVKIFSRGVTGELPCACGWSKQGLDSSRDLIAVFESFSPILSSHLAEALANKLHYFIMCADTINICSGCVLINR